jgi:tetratricopeptide (TPR) repeat protein
MRYKLCIAVALATVTLAVYWQVGNCGFLRYDDLPYVTGNLHVQGGVTWEAVRWAFSAMHAGNWHPLAWLSHMVDCQLYGLDPRGHHFTSLCFHIANTLLLFFLFTRMTGATWRSAFVAALFALHPLHVESVAWVAERKDVLSTFFWFLTMLLYAGYVARPGRARYLSVVLCFLAGLMAKPMLVTLPFVLLLMDYWPLCRVPWAKTGPPDSGRTRPAEGTGVMMPVRLLIWEKIPLFALAAISSIITFYAQRKGGAVSSLEAVPFASRMINALVAWTGYIGKMIWPRNLSVIYPLDPDLSAWQALLAGGALAVMTALLLNMARRRPYLIVGWLWYLGTLVPVIGLVQVGVQAMADRYTYIPLVGLFVMISWGIPGLVAGWRYRQGVMIGAAAAVLSLLSVATWQQLGYWRDGYTLFSRAISATRANYFAQNEVGVALAGQGRFDEAYSHFRESLRLEPRFADPHYNWGFALAQQGKLDDAIDHFSEALRLKPGFAEAHNNLALAYSIKGLPEQGLEHLLIAERLSPGDASIQYNLGVAYRKKGLSGEALRHFERAARLEPDDPDFRRSMMEMNTTKPQSK